MINKIMKEYIEKDNNINTNYKAIFSKIKERNNTSNWKKKIINSVAILFAVVLVGTASTQIYAKIAWDIQFKEYQNREYKYGVGEKELTETVNMEYIEQDGIKVKVDSLMITDEHFEAKINFEFADNIELNSQTFQFGYAVYDEEKNIYGIFGRIDNQNDKRGWVYHRKCIYRELGIKENDKVPIMNSTGIGKISAIDRNIISKISMNSRIGFPKSKKIYIRIFDLEYYMADDEFKTTEFFPISDAEWIFEINVPESIYNRKTENLKLKEQIPGLEINHIKVTDTGFILQGKMEEIYNTMMSGKDMNPEEWTIKKQELINITDSEGNIYNLKNSGSTTEKNGFSCDFEINNDIINSRQLFLNITVNGKKYSSELIKE